MGFGKDFEVGLISGVAWYGRVRLGPVRYGLVRILWFGRVSFGTVWYGTDSLARRGMLRFALLGFGMDSKVWWRTVGRGKVC